MEIVITLLLILLVSVCLCGYKEWLRLDLKINLLQIDLDTERKKRQYDKEFYEEKIRLMEEHKDKLLTIWRKG